MATLSDTIHGEISADLQRRLSELNIPCSVLKSIYKTSAAALDSWLDTNAASANQALPAAAQTGFTKQIKAELMMLVIIRRYLEDA